VCKLFEMTVDDVFAIRNIYTVYGECNGFEKLRPGTIRDESGNEYPFSIPFGKPLEIDNNKIELQLMVSDVDLDSLMGQKLFQ